MRFNTTPDKELVKLKQNPVSGLRQVVLQAVVSPNTPASGKTAGNYSIQPVWPFSLGEDWRLITYTMLPVIQLKKYPNIPTTLSGASLGADLPEFVLPNLAVPK